MFKLSGTLKLSTTCRVFKPGKMINLIATFKLRRMFKLSKGCELSRMFELTQENKTIHKDQSGCLWIHIRKFLLYGFFSSPYRKSD